VIADPATAAELGDADLVTVNDGAGAAVGTTASCDWADSTTPAGVRPDAVARFAIDPASTSACRTT
jgi:hypothetical protein